MLKQKKGITLIALVITIIVLLILAGISIATLTGENGVLTQANNAKLENRGGAVEEARDLWKTNQKIEEYVGDNGKETLDQLLARLKSENLLNDQEINIIKETGTITIGSHKIDFFDDNPIELTYQLWKENSEYAISIGFKYGEDEFPLSYKQYVEQELGGKILEQKGEIFLKYVSYMDMQEGFIDKEYASLEEFFRIAYEKKRYEKLYTSLEGFVNEVFGSEEEFTWFLADEVLSSEYRKEYYRNGTLINPDGSEINLTTESALASDSEYYTISKNGDYKFKFINYDGRTGEITVRINEDTPQIIGELGKFDGIFAVTAGFNNFIQIEKVNMKLWEIENKTELINEREVDLTPYIKVSDGYDSWGFPEGCYYVNASSEEEIYQDTHYAQITVVAGGKEIKRNSKINIYPM